MGYVEANLQKDEEIVLRAKISRKVIIADFIKLGLKGLGLIIATILFSQGPLQGLAELISEELSQILGELGFLWVLLNVVKVAAWLVYSLFIIVEILGIVEILKQELVITQKRIMMKAGLFSVRAIDIPIDKVDNVFYSANFFGSIFHYYNMTVTMTSGEKIILFEMENAREFKNAVLEGVEKYREEQRKAQAEEIAKSMLKKSQE